MLSEHLATKFIRFVPWFQQNQLKESCHSSERGEDLDDASRAETRALGMPGLTCQRWYRSGHGQLHIFDSNFKTWAALLCMRKGFFERGRGVISGLLALRPGWIWVGKWKAKRAGWNMAEGDERDRDQLHFDIRKTRVICVCWVIDIVSKNVLSTSCCFVWSLKGYLDRNIVT